MPIVQSLLGKLVRVTRLLDKSENHWLIDGYPCWKLETPLVSPLGGIYVGVYDYCLAPLPDEGDVFEFDHEAELVREQEKELL